MLLVTQCVRDTCKDEVVSRALYCSFERCPSVLVRFAIGQAAVSCTLSRLVRSNVVDYLSRRLDGLRIQGYVCLLPRLKQSS